MLEKTVNSISRYGALTDNVKSHFLNISVFPKQFDLLGTICDKQIVD